MDPSAKEQKWREMPVPRPGAALMVGGDPETHFLPRSTGPRRRTVSQCRGGVDLRLADSGQSVPTVKSACPSMLTVGASSLTRL